MFFSILAKVCFYFVLMAVFIKWGASSSRFTPFLDNKLFLNCRYCLLFQASFFCPLVTKVLKKKDFKWYLVEDRGKKIRCTFLGKQLQALELKFVRNKNTLLLTSFSCYFVVYHKILLTFF